MSQQRQVQINEKTNVPLGVAVAAGIFLCGSVIWAARVEWVASATAKALAINIEERKKESDDLRKDVEKLSSRILVLSCHLKVPDPDCPGRSSRSQ